MRKYLKGALAGLFATMLLLGAISAYMIISLQSNAKLINYVGIVRGASQRLVKLELKDQQHDDLIKYLDDILQELNGSHGEYQLPKPNDETYRKNLSELSEMWGNLKQDIFMYRNHESDGTEVLKHSEEYFEKANDTVFAAQDYTDTKLHELMFIWVGMLFIMLIVWAFIFWAASKKMLDLETANRRLTDIMKRDNLTGVYQYIYFKEKAQRLLDKAGDKKYAVIYTDFSDFKYINDVFGYTYGDSILANYGKILLEGLDNDELCGRVNADNFVLLVKYQNMEDVASRQRKADMLIRDFMQKEYNHQVITTNCGICCLESVEEKLTIGGYVDRANLTRGTVKNGTNFNYMYYNEGIRNHMMEEKNMESRMQKALENREFVVEYQPKVDLKTEKIASAEALIRWKINGKTIMSPDAFIPIFERKFRINELDQYVMEEVCRWLREMLDAGKRILPVAVNVSRLQFYDPHFVERYVELRERYQIPYEFIEIEFTESIVFDNGGLLSVVEDLKRNHFRCSIDDFGKGYSSLSLLKNLPVDYLKIDQYFFKQGKDRTRDLALVQGIVEIVHKLGMKTIAEGIEEERQVELLKEMGCDYIQGYIFYRPMNNEQYEELLQGEQ